MHRVSSSMIHKAVALKSAGALVSSSMHRVSLSIIHKAVALKSAGAISLQLNAQSKLIYNSQGCGSEECWGH